MNDHSVMAIATTDARNAALRSKRDAILDAALALFSELTFDGTPVPAIAERAGVGAGTIYRYFPSKEALANAVFRRGKEAMRRRLIDDAPADATPREGFRHLWRALWGFATEDPLAFQFLETHHHAPYLDAESHAAGEEMAVGVRAYVAQAQQAGAIRDTDAGVLIALVFGAFIGLVKAATNDGRAVDEATIAEAEACIWQMLSA